MSIGPAAPITPGNGYKYKTWTSTGLASLTDLIDDGGCGQSLLADTWVEVLDIPINNDVNGTFFELSNDSYTTGNNLDYWLSLNGLESDPNTQLSFIGIICSQTTAVASTKPADLLTLAPNPTNGVVRVNVGLVDGPFMFEVLDPLGRAVEMKYVAAASGAWSGTIDLSKLEAGAYQVRVYLGDQVHSSTVLLQH
ncbi:MAG TPA: T9SS type A sorting domain-containing protein, partial [Flavobacteriales bacterium]|nr:T9SS type A sorting domain-containing protein [Flavobacteriales bacterium]